MAPFLIPFMLILAGVAALMRSNRFRPLLLPLAGVVQVVAWIAVMAHPQLAITSSWLTLDPVAKLVMGIVSVVYLATTLYAVPYLWGCKQRDNQVFCICFVAFAGMANLLFWSHHLGLMWVAIEAVALVSAPLIYFSRSSESIEAMWKYLLVGSVGIALALLGTFFLAYAALHAGLPASLSYDELLRCAPSLSKPWFRAGFLLLLIGYGTKMGLAPMHTWKPDAYGEAPGVVGALFSGAITSCAFLTLMRMYHIGIAAGEGAFMSRYLLVLGLFSMTIAAVFMIRQRDIKRLLAYSSVEQMGILAVGLGIGAPALYGVLLHLVANGLTKSAMFMSAGSIRRAYGSKHTDMVSGALRVVPISATIFLAGFLAITGSPPFVPFVSTFSILTAAFSSQHFITAVLFLVLLLAVFIGMGSTVLSVVQGTPPADIVKKQLFKDRLATSLPAAGMLGLVLVLGLFIPGWLSRLLQEAVAYLAGSF